MAVVGGSEPSVAISVPVPTPVTPKPKPKQPRGINPRGGNPSPDDDQPQTAVPHPVSAPRPAPVDNWHAVILPWTPGAKRMRRLPERVVKYNRALEHKAFQEAIRSNVWNPDLTARKAYADWLDEHPGEAEPGASDILRHHNGPQLSIRHEPGKPVGVDFQKTVMPALSPVWTGAPRKQAVVLRIEYKNRQLSISGRHGKSSYGQVQDSIGPKSGYVAAKGWTPGHVKKLREIWERWHLNDMRAGSPAQEEFLRNNPLSEEQLKEHAQRTGYRYGYDYYRASQEHLANAGLDPDPNFRGGYRYGSAHVHEDVPPDVLKFLASLPDSDRRH